MVFPIILGFAAEIDGIDHPAAIFKFSGKNGYCWSWLQPSSGHLINIDLLSATRKELPEVTEYHGSYHHSGQRHQTVKSRNDTEHISVYAGVPIQDIREWESFKSITVPLIEPFPWDMDAKPWVAVKSLHILRSEDFDGADGVDLHGFICRKDRVNDLARRWGSAKQLWMAGSDDLRLVVLAKPIFHAR
jgi:hypothetical protein